MTLREIIEKNKKSYPNIDINKMKLRRESYDIKTAYVHLKFIDGIYTFAYVENGISSPLHWQAIIADDWYIVKNEKEDRETKLKHKLNDIITETVDNIMNEVLNTLED
jgi:hypothetical protein